MVEYYNKENDSANKCTDADTDKINEELDFDDETEENAGEPYLVRRDGIILRAGKYEAFINTLHTEDFLQIEIESNPVDIFVVNAEDVEKWEQDSEVDT